MIGRKSAAFSEAPPTRAPPTSGTARMSRALSGLTEPPYRIGTAATPRPSRSIMAARTARWTSSICSSVGVRPVPMAQTLEQIEEVHRAVRAAMIERLGLGVAAVPILYGGSVKPDNARDILAVPEVGGALVGGASLKAADFLGIIRAV